MDRISSMSSLLIVTLLTYLFISKEIDFRHMSQLQTKLIFFFFSQDGTRYIHS